MSLVDPPADQPADQETGWLTSPAVGGGVHKLSKVEGDDARLLKIKGRKGVSGTDQEQAHGDVLWHAHVARPVRVEGLAASVKRSLQDPSEAKRWNPYVSH